ncbi:fatty acid desaturase-domain-containing protein [Entophlyctis helioformis]|nr:fatty acid desaturase-domain-containing protein [Entophlyctis helioformis]
MAAASVTTTAKLAKTAAAKKTAASKADSKPVVLGKHASKEAATTWTPPPFTLKDVRDAIPAHCFKRDTLRSFGYVFHDLALAAGLAYAASYIQYLSIWQQAIAWPTYWFAQGNIGVGIWILAHECGHQAFSPSSFINNTVGYILHTIVLVPYYSWKYSHSKHHKATGHMTKDQPFVPVLRSNVKPHVLKKYTEEEIAQLDHSLEHELTEIAPIAILYENFMMLLFGWPWYLLVNAWSQKHPGWVSHFKPSSPIFDARQYWGVVASNVGILGFIGFLFYLGQVFGSLTVISYYVIPYLMVNAWLVTITFLQHTSPKCPHYSDEEWDFLRGALSTVDRDFGILNHFHHHISDTHVVHHLFSTMPHYHAQEATEAVKKFLGKYYLYDDTPIWRALYESQRYCRFVEHTGNVLFYKY